MILDKKELALIMAELGKETKQGKDEDYKRAYIDGILDFYNRATRKLEEPAEAKDVNSP